MLLKRYVITLLHYLSLSNTLYITYFQNYAQREVVEQLLLEPIANQAILSDNLRKVYHGKDGNPDKLAVRGLSLAIPKGQCFGMLGPNGAGKTSFVSMVQQHNLLLQTFDKI